MDKQYSIQFFTKFVEAMQKFCRDYIEFEQAVELSGYLSLEIDNYKKERYVLSEMVHSTGDVISESYCVKAFKTMKRLPSKSDTVLRDTVNVRATGVAASRDVTIDLRHSPEPRSPHHAGFQPSSVRHRAANSYRSVSGVPQSSHRQGQRTSPSMSPSNKRTHLPFAAGAANQVVDKQSDVFNSQYESHSSGHNTNNEELLEIQPRQSVLISSSQTVSTIAAEGNSESSSFAPPKDDSQTPEAHARGQKRSIPISEDAPFSKKDKTDGDLDSLITAATSIVPVSEADVNSFKSLYDSQSKPISADTGSSESPSASLPSESIRLPLPGNIHIKEEVSDIVLLDSPDNGGDNSDLAQLEVSFGVAGQDSSSEWNTQMQSSSQPKFSQTTTPTHIWSASHNMSRGAGSKSMKKRKVHKCNMCSYETYYTTSLDKHIIIHSGDYLKCSICPSRFTSRTALHYHMKGHAGMLACTVCGKKYTSYAGLSRHKKFDHRINMQN
ncbi:zinc finger and BTB domain-containing protein 20-like isoform X8 [Gigantopelta aegis]|uniref:zinc finger and BTB domain-containing protein 20-like isoform X8 n=1 Tax=Gigantopelta aegis TaxID=1735272 RepID=UPI001B8887E8|nr:zinc finger and BTB domain-containing protein 20-like isoform X8 [Gigantopelta aegis]